MERSLCGSCASDIISFNNCQSGICDDSICSDSDALCFERAFKQAAHFASIPKRLVCSFESRFYILAENRAGVTSQLHSVLDDYSFEGPKVTPPMMRTPSLAKR